VAEYCPTGQYNKHGVRIEDDGGEADVYAVNAEEEKACLGRIANGTEKKQRKFEFLFRAWLTSFL